MSLLWLRRRVNFTMNTRCFQRNFCAASSPLVPVPLPSPVETHLWYLVPNEVKNETLLNKYLELLSTCERENVFRMSGDQLRKRALLARALVRTTISRYQTNCEVHPRSLRFRKNIYGKPEVDWQDVDDRHLPPLHFNISHTSSLIACGVTVNSPIGIDVEEKQRKLKNNILAFARRYFSPYEVELLTAISDPEFQRQEFIKLWTLKAFDIVINTFDDPKNLTNNWQFALLDLAGSHYAAICTEKDRTAGGKGTLPMKLTVWRTIPFVEDECVSGTDAVVAIAGLT
ncbi:hypothetical protein FH972_009071 [Carpinus fangiana]|uniref:holo-[acyl-carrier-protein] synthase n=1 Tax=Carpinus fangiana TaxID=176857 RepID=A0A5N6R3H7_9ROSI|nr:hypothetical protein FH972_009071 [Carpinus fangiana]